jgi:hypothetical protein
MEDLAVVGDKPKFQVGDLVFLNNIKFRNLAVTIVGVEKCSDGYYYELKNDRGFLVSENVLSKHPKSKSYNEL